MRSIRFMPVFSLFFLLDAACVSSGIFPLLVAANILFLFCQKVFRLAPVFFGAWIVAQLAAGITWSVNLRAFEQQPQQINGSSLVLSVQNVSGRQRLLLQTTESDEQYYAYVPFTTAQIGDTVKLSCTLDPPLQDDQGYRMYLAAQGIAGVCTAKKAEVLVRGIPFSKNPVLFIKRAVSFAIKRLWGNPVSSLVAGLLLGTRESFPQETLLEFRRSGITHIIALSGFNITILVVFFERALLSIGLKPKWRLLFTLLSILLFTVLVGAGASIVRAAIMGSLILVGKFFARRVQVMRVLLLTAAVMVLQNPFILLYDLGFQLSFLATMGLMLFAEPLQERLAWLPSAFEIRESLSSTLAASLLTLPLLIFRFSALSTVAPLANVLILPFIPLTMALGALTVAASFLHLPFFLGRVTVALLCNYLVSVSKWTSSYSWSYLAISSPGVAAGIGFVLVLLIFIWLRYEMVRALFVPRRVGCLPVTKP